MTQQPFPGNVRELENTIERGVVLARDTEVVPSDLSPRVSTMSSGPEVSLPALEDEDFALDDYLGQVEYRLIMKAIEATGGNRTAAARKLGISFRSLRYRLAKVEGDE